MTRWERLERYSRWRQRRLRIDRLPHDVVLNVISFLDHADVCTLLNALYAVPRANIRSRSEVGLVPAELRTEWLNGAADDGLRRTLYALGEIAFFHARDCSRVCAHVDWSVFSGPRMPVPLCVYEWSHRGVAAVEVCDAEVRRVVHEAGRTGRTAVTLALYKYLWWGSTWILHPDPCHQRMYAVYPYFVLSECLHSQWTRQ